MKAPGRQARTIARTTKIDLRTCFNAETLAEKGSNTGANEGIAPGSITPSTDYQNNQGRPTRPPLIETPTNLS